MEGITFEQNEKTLEKLQKSYNQMWDIVFFGDKKSGTKPGDIRTLEKVFGIRQVAEERMKLRQNLINNEEKGRG